MVWNCHHWVAVAYRHWSSPANRGFNGCVISIDSIESHYTLDAIIKLVEIHESVVEVILWHIDMMYVQCDMSHFPVQGKIFTKIHQSTDAYFTCISKSQLIDTESIFCYTIWTCRGILKYCHHLDKQMILIYWLCDFALFEGGSHYEYFHDDIILFWQYL